MPCHPQENPQEGIATPHTPRESRLPSLEKLCVPWKVPVVLEATPGHTGNLHREPDRNHTISLVCFHLGTLLEAHMGSTQAESGARPGLGGAGGQGSGLVPPLPWRQAAGFWLCPSSWGGRPASPGLTLPPAPPSPPSARTSVCSWGMWLPAPVHPREDFSPDARAFGPHPFFWEQVLRDT